MQFDMLSERYQLQDPIGRGGMATIYRGLDTRMDRIVAIKVLREVYCTDPKFATRFQRQAKAASALQHPHIVQVYDYGQSSDNYYIVMELVDGTDLRRYLRVRGILNVDRAITIAHDIALGLGAAHCCGIVHREVKPQNILVGRNISIKLTAFGIASICKDINVERLTTTDVALDTMEYYAPEQVQGETVSPATDVYALGIVLYEMLTGRRPFDGDTPVALAMQHIRDQPMPPSQLNPTIPPAIEEIILRCLEKTPKVRFANGSALARVLEGEIGIENDLSTVIHPTPGQEQPSVSQLERPEQGAIVFVSYAHPDKRLRDKLEDHLSILKYRGLITTWHDRQIKAGEEWTQQIDIHLNKAHIILLLLSAAFMASEYCYGIEMKRALERYEQREAEVIPILLRPVLFAGAPFTKLHMLPTNRKSVSQWRDRDSAFVNIATGIEEVARKYASATLTTSKPLMNTSSNIVEQEAVPSTKTSRRRTANFTTLIPILILIATVLLLVYSVYHGFLLQVPVSALIEFLRVFVEYIAIFVVLLLLIVGCIALVSAVRAIRTRIERRRRYYQEAIAAYRLALRRNSSDGDAFRGMGNALFALKRHQEARNAFRQAIQYKPTPTAYAGLGDVYAKLKRYSEAVAAYEKAIELDPAVTLNRDEHVRSLLAQGREEEAEQARARARQLGYEED